VDYDFPVGFCIACTPDSLTRRFSQALQMKRGDCFCFEEIAP
jgi:hypothetical protein